MEKLKIDKDKCIGCGSCEFNCPEVFEINISSGKAEVKKDVNIADHQEAVDRAISECPTKAINYEE